MSTAATRKLPRLGLSPEKGNEIFGLVLCAAVILLTGSLVSYHPLDPSVFHHTADFDAPTHNFVGPFGAQLSALCFGLFGLASFLVPALLALAAWRRLTHRSASESAARFIAWVAMVPAIPAMLQLVFGRVIWRGEELQAGGGVGVVISDLLSEGLNPGGAFVVLLAILLVAGSLAVQSTLGELFEALKKLALEIWERAQLLLAQRRKRSEEKAAKRRVIRHVQQGQGVTTAARSSTARAAAPAPRSASTGASTVAPKVGPPSLEDVPIRSRPTLESVRVTEKKGEGHFAVRKVKPPEPPAPEPVPQQEVLEFDDEEMQLSELPPVNLLKTDLNKSFRDEAELMRQGEVIRQSFEHFGIEGTVAGISPGPVITVFEFQPAPGIKVSKIVNLQDDLALALKAESVRIDRMPGRSTLGLEVPNDTRSLIHLGRLLNDEKFQKAPSHLTMALGVDIHGTPYFADLATMPHLLVAGATGAGKSVGLQSMITSILYKATRDDVQFIFIDPKRIELGVYADIPHLKTEVVVEPKKAANALRWAVGEMERRYRLLAEVHVRSIAYYNRAIKDPAERGRLALKEEAESEFRAEDFKPLPYYVIIIDELADLMMVASSDVETSIARLAQMARAVGIHLIVATQRPSVDVLTGTIKANFPCRLSFATATRHDSRTILDQVGSEKLLGKGDALFIPPGTSRVLRLHGAYISEQETASLIRWLKRRGKPELDLDILKEPETEASSGSGGGADDDLYDEASRLVVAERMASASFLQRRMRVGFSRAARLIDMMEADGLLGPSQGSKPREVLVPPDFYEEIDRARSQE